MPHAVFVSYSSKDTQVAEAVCTHLEQAGVPCWIAPRDVHPGASYGEALLRAIEECKVFVLVLSSHSMASPLVEREVERAVSKGVAIVPMRIDRTPLSKTMEYFLSASHWLDASTPPFEKHLATLGVTVPRLLQHIGDRQVGEFEKRESDSPWYRRPAILRTRLLPIGLALCVVAAGIMYISMRNEVPQNSPAMVFEEPSSSVSSVGTFDQELISQLKKVADIKAVFHRMPTDAGLSDDNKLAEELGCLFLLNVATKQEKASQRLEFALIDLIDM